MHSNQIEKHSHYDACAVILGKHSHYEYIDLDEVRENCCIDAEIVVLMCCVTKLHLNHDCTEKCWIHINSNQIGKHSHYDAYAVKLGKHSHYDTHIVKLANLNAAGTIIGLY